MLEEHRLLELGVPCISHSGAGQQHWASSGVAGKPAPASKSNLPRCRRIPEQAEGKVHLGADASSLVLCELEGRLGRLPVPCRPARDQVAPPTKSPLSPHGKRCCRRGSPEAVARPPAKRHRDLQPELSDVGDTSQRCA